LTPEFQKQWADALTSGKYQQNRYGWTDGDVSDERHNAHCCLSVAMVEAGVWPDFVTYFYRADSFDTYAFIAEKLDISKKAVDKFVAMNDSILLEFPAIAELIPETVAEV
jgi:hypothetical protein